MPKLKHNLYVKCTAQTFWGKLWKHKVVGKSSTNVLSLSGLTESCGGCFTSIANVFPMTGSVGVPMTTIEARLESVPEMGYDALGSVPRGEICLRGKTLFSGYHKREDLTKDVVVDGWFHTGEVHTLLLVFRNQNQFSPFCSWLNLWESISESEKVLQVISGNGSPMEQWKSSTGKRTYSSCLKGNTSLLKAWKALILDAPSLQQ